MAWLTGRHTFGKRYFLVDFELSRSQPKAFSSDPPSRSLRSSFCIVSPSLDIRVSGKCCAATGAPRG